MSYSPQLSTGMYVGLCGYIGTPAEITMRREVVDIEGLLYNNEPKWKALLSGSFREGFRFKSSDKDFMIWMIRDKVITDLSQCVNYDLFKHSILLVEDIDTPPGFVRLELISSPSETINSSAIRIDHIWYVSSSIYKNLLINIGYPIMHQTLSIHGPCLQSCREYEEIDCAFCCHCIY